MQKIILKILNVKYLLKLLGFEMHNPNKNENDIKIKLLLIKDAQKSIKSDIKNFFLNLNAKSIKNIQIDIVPDERLSLIK